MNAREHFWIVCNSADRGQSKVGMVVVVSSHTLTSAGSTYGHVQIFIDGNKSMDNVGRIRAIDFDNLLDYYSTIYVLKWDWYNKQPLVRAVRLYFCLKKKRSGSVGQLDWLDKLKMFLVLRQSSLAKYLQRLNHAIVHDMTDAQSYALIESNNEKSRLTTNGSSFMLRLRQS